MTPAPQTATQTSLRRLLIIVLAVIAAVLLLAAFVSMRRGELPVRVERLTRDSITSSISTDGKIEAVQNFEAHAIAPAPVKRVLVKPGDQVKAGQLLLQLDDAQARAQAARALAQVKAAEADLRAVQSGGTQEEVLTNQAQLVQARTALNEAQRTLQATQKLQTTGAASAAEVQAAQDVVRRAQAQVTLLEQKQHQRYSGPEVARVQAQLSDAQAQYQAAQALLANANVHTPRAGTVYSLPVKPGNFVNAGELLVQVADPAIVQVRAFVDEPDIGRLARGQKVQITWDALPGRVWEGTVTNIPTTVMLRGSRTVGEITAQVDNTDAKLLPNVNVSVVVVTARHENVLVLSREAVHQEDGQRYVFQVVNGELKKTPVETSLSNLTRIEITGGLNENAQVALGTTNGQPLKASVPVRVTQ